MLVLAIFALCFGVSCSNGYYSREMLQEKYPGFGTDWVPLGQKDNGELIIGYFNESHEKGRFLLTPEPSEVVTFTLYTRENPNGTLIEDPISTYPNFDKTKPVKFMTHGWMSSGTGETCTSIKNGFLEKYDANVFVMDWSKISGNVFYPMPMAATSSVGEFYGKFLNELVGAGVDAKQMHLVGHSLGAHVSGFAARELKSGKVGRVTGLDPASPGFNNFELIYEGRLGKDDADFVDVIHTCGGFLGISKAIGHADFYPNGGSVPQPGCGILEMMEACSHGRSWKYFAESLTSEIPFMAYPCDSFEELMNGDGCEDGVVMGDDTPVDVRGVYYLRTKENAPFAIKQIEDDIDNVQQSL